MKFTFTIVVSLVIGFGLGFVFFYNDLQHQDELHVRVSEEKWQCADKFSLTKAHLKFAVVNLEQLQKSVEASMEASDSFDGTSKNVIETIQDRIIKLHGVLSEDLTEIENDNTWPN